VLGWPALYMSLDLGASLGEIVRRGADVDLNEIRFTEIEVALATVADCRNLSALGVDPVALFDDWDYSAGQALANAVRQAGSEGMLVPSASRVGDNLIVFPDLLRPTSTLTIVRTVDPKLIKDAR